MKKINVLIVDDSAVVRQVLSAKLTEHARINVLDVAADPIYALEKMQKHWPDVIVLDVEMPRMDGISLTRKLRENPGFKSTPILILTTESSDQMKQAGRSAGATGWLVKPFDPGRLIEVIQKVIR